MVTTTPPLNSGESSYVFNEGLAIKSLQHIDEPLDPRLGLSSGPYVDGIDSTLGRTLAEKSQPLDEVIYVRVLFTESLEIHTYHSCRWISSREMSEIRPTFPVPKSGALPYWPATPH
jgi:hypothetical protein